MARELLRNTRALAVIALIALLLLGVGGYAVFQEILTAQIQVTTGRFDIDIVGASVQDNEPANLDIAQCEASIAPDGESVNINVQNSYPEYVCDVGLTVRNLQPSDSTIPGKFVGINLVQPPPGWLTLTFTGPPVGERIDPGDSVNVQIEIKIEAGAPESGAFGVTVNYIFQQFLP